MGPGIEHVEGDMFINVPKGDAIIMKVYKKVKFITTMYYLSPQTNDLIVLTNVEYYA